MEYKLSGLGRKFWFLTNKNVSADEQNYKHTWNISLAPEDHGTKICSSRFFFE
jgi:hypothetical protein